FHVTGVQTCALPICGRGRHRVARYRAAERVAPGRSSTLARPRRARRARDPPPGARQRGTLARRLRRRRGEPRADGAVSARNPLRGARGGGPGRGAGEGGRAAVAPGRERLSLTGAKYSLGHGVDAPREVSMDDEGAGRKVLATNRADRPALRWLTGPVKLVAIAVGAVVSVVALMSLVGLFTDSVWIELGVAAV